MKLWTNIRVFKWQSIISLLIALTATGPARTVVANKYDPGAAGNAHTTWSDSVGTLALRASAGNGGSTRMVWTRNSRTKLGRAYVATNANFNVGTAAGLSNGPYTFEIWLHFGGSVVANQVIFETGGSSNGVGLFTNQNGIELATSSISTGADAMVSISLQALNLNDYVQLVAVFDPQTDTIQLQATDVDGVQVRGSAVSDRPLRTGTSNGWGLFGGGNGDFNNDVGHIGGSGAAGASISAEPKVFSGRIGYFQIYDAIAWAQTTASFQAIVLPPTGDTRPNIIVIYTDDHGYSDVGAQGYDEDVSTPHLDMLAEEGIRFTHGYVTAPQCVPSRAGLLTGRYQGRFGVDDNAYGPLRLEEVTIAERLREAGYRTGMVGKWHLNPYGVSEAWASEHEVDPNAIPASLIRQYYPGEQGFEEFHSGNLNRVWANFGRRGANLDPLGESIDETGHRVDIQSDAAVSFIERNYDRPFFLYLAYYAPHTPLEWVERYENAFDPQLPVARRKALGMIKAMDDGLGAILAKLDEHHIDEKTLIWFVGDNGAPLGFQEARRRRMSDASVLWDGSKNKPWLGEKGMLAEAGIRVPWVMRWKNGLASRAVSADPVISLDIAATIAAAAGLSLDPKFDGLNLLPFFANEPLALPKRQLFWRFWGQSAVREDRWKYLKLADGAEFLFDLASPRHEAANQLLKHPTLAARLRRDLEAWQATLHRPGYLQAGLNIAEQRWYRHFFAWRLGTEFQTEGKFEGWKPSGFLTPAVRNGTFTGTPTVGAKLTDDDFSVEGAAIDGMLLRLRTQLSGTIELQWGQLEEDAFDSERSVKVPVTGSEDLQILSFPLESIPDWKSKTITQVQIVFHNASSEPIEIDWIRPLYGDGDRDRDGVPDEFDAFPFDSSESIDTDADGIGNNADQDDDSDGLSDADEALWGSNPLAADSDNDGMVDGVEVTKGRNPIVNEPAVLGVLNLLE